MTEAAPTLRALFSEPDLKTRNESPPGGDDAGAQLRKELPGFEWVASKYDFASKINDVLDLGLPDVLFSFWRKSDEIGAALRESLESPDEEVDFCFWEHEMDGTLEPCLEVRIGKAPGIRTFEIPFTLSLNLALEGIVLRIKNGAIVRIVAGKCSATGTLKLGDLVLATAPRKDQGPITFEMP